MARIIDPFDKNDEPEDEDELEGGANIEDLQGMVQNMLSAFGLSPGDLLDGQIEPVNLALQLTKPFHLEERDVMAFAEAAFGEDATYIGMKGSSGGTSIHMVEVEEMLFNVISYDPRDKKPMPDELVDHPFLEEVGRDVPWLSVQVHEEMEDDAAWEDEDGEDEDENEEDGTLEPFDGQSILSQVQELFGDEDPFTAQERIMHCFTAEILEKAEEVCEKIYVPATGKWKQYKPVMKTILRSGESADYFAGGAMAPRGFEADDPGLLAAAEEARSHFEEFREAFINRDPDDDETSFSVKAPFSEEDEDEDEEVTEHLWVEVTAIVGGTILGEIANEPVDLTTYELGEEVEVELEEIEDWLIKKGEDWEGGFSIKYMLEQGEMMEDDDEER